MMCTPQVCTCPSPCLYLIHDVISCLVCLNVLCARLGSHLAHFWSKQMMYDPSVKPYGKHGLADMLEGDPLFRAKRTANELPTFTLRLGQLITDGAKVSRAVGLSKGEGGHCAECTPAQATVGPLW